MKHEWNRTGEYFAMNPPIYIVRCEVCGQMAKDHAWPVEGKPGFEYEYIIDDSMAGECYSAYDTADN